jgi:rhamnose transport system permease protein
MNRGRYRLPINLREMTLLCTILILGIAITLKNPVFASPDNLFSVLSDVTILAIVSFGQMVVMVSGGIDLSVGTGMGLIGMVFGLVHVFNQSISPVFLVAMCAIAGATLGLFNGFLVSVGGIVPLIATLATMNIFRGVNVLVNAAFYRGQYIGANKLSEGFMALTRGHVLGIPLVLIYIAVLFGVGLLFLRHTYTGRYIYAIGTNEEGARMAGISVTRIKLLAYALSGLCFGLGGILWVSRYATAQSDTGLGLEFTAVTAAIVGGVSVMGGSGSLFGVLLGAVLISVMNNALSVLQISQFWKQAILGLVLLTAILSNKWAETRSSARKLVIARQHEGAIHG